MEQPMLTIAQAQMPERLPDVQRLIWEYLRWGNGMLRREYGIELDVVAMLRSDMSDVEKYAPPMGCLLLAEWDGVAAGCACMRNLAPGVGEVKRMFVRPAQRRKGIGRALLSAVLDRALAAGYSHVRLDSVRFMREAHNLYRSVGFREIAPYSDGELPEHFHPYWVFMEKDLFAA